MNDRWRIPKAILKRELTSYFSSPTGYVFITLFVFLSAVASFWQEAFFNNNLANLDSLNSVFPYLLLFLIPAITMTLWAEEKRNGTDELLLTLPATDLEIVAGKYLAALAIYSVALLFSLSHLVVLWWLGSPDVGLMFSTYFGYWLMGAALMAVGMLASLLTSNLTVAFILGSVFCAVPVFIIHAGAILSGGLRRLVEGLSFTEQFRDLAAGVISFSSVLYFVSFALAMLYLNVALLGRRHWPSRKGSEPRGRHTLVRGAALVVIVASITVLAGRLGGRLDATAERLHSLSEETGKLIDGLDSAHPVFIQAYLSPVVPRRYLQTRNNIVSVLRELDAMGGDRIHAQILETEKYSPAAREAQDLYSIRPRPIAVWEQTAGSDAEIYMGIAFRSGGEEFVIPFFDPGLAAEYELMRSIRLVAHAERKKVGILETKAKLFGGFDFQTRVPTPDWSIVEELRKQYEVVRVRAGADYPGDIDVLIAVLPHTLEADELVRLTAYASQGHPLLLLVDPLPAFDMQLSPQPIPASPFPFNQPPPTPPTDIKPLMDAIGVAWSKEEVAWDQYNPHPQFGALPEEVIFVAAGNEAAEGAFNSDEPVSAGLQEMVLLYPGRLQPAAEAAEDQATEGETPEGETAEEEAEAGEGEAADETAARQTFEFVSLLETGRDSGVVPWRLVVQASLFGMQINPNPPHEADEEVHILAARVTGSAAENPVRAIVIADVDMMSEQFFELRRQGIENLNFDNVTFLLNAVDHLAGDESFVALRKHRPRHRTLEAVEARTRVYEQRRLEETQQAEADAEEQLQEAQARLDGAVETLRQRSDLDQQTKQIMVANLQQVENRRLAVARSNIEDRRQQQIERSRADMETSIRGIQSTIQLLAVVLPPIPALVLFVFVSLRRVRREKIGISPDRLVQDRR